MNEEDKIYELVDDFPLPAGRARDDLLVADLVRVVEMWDGQKARRVERFIKKKNKKWEKIGGPHAKVDHKTKKAVMGALSPDDLKAVGCKNPDVYIKSNGNEDDDDLIVIVRPGTHAKNVGQGRKHITGVHARDVLGDDYRDKLNVLKLTTTHEADVLVFTLIWMAHGKIYRFIQRQVDERIIHD